MTDLQPPDPLAAQLLGEEPHDRFALHVGDNPLPARGIESDRHLLAVIRLAQALVPVVPRDQARAVGTPIPDPVRQEGIDPAHIPHSGLVLDAIGALRAEQLRVGVEARTPLDRRILLALGPAGSVQLLLQRRQVGPGVRFGPLLRHPMAARDLGIAPGPARRVPDPRDPQPDQPQRQVGRQVVGRSPGVAVGDADPLGQSPPREGVAASARLAFSTASTGQTSWGRLAGTITWRGRRGRRG